MNTVSFPKLLKSLDLKKASLLMRTIDLPIISQKELKPSLEKSKIFFYIPQDGGGVGG